MFSQIDKNGLKKPNHPAHPEKPDHPVHPEHPEKPPHPNRRYLSIPPHESFCPHTKNILRKMAQNFIIR